jgi:UDP-glucose 4-epimerase
VARRFLDDGWDVTVLARRAPDAAGAALLDGAAVVLGDADGAALRESLDGAAHVVHALGVPHPAASAAAPRRQYEVEVGRLLRVLDELRRRPGTSLTYVSSGGAIYGDAEVLPVGEDAPCRPRSPYGATKLMAERQVGHAVVQDGLRARIVRVANAFGARQRHDTGQGIVATLLHAARTGAPVTVFGDGTAVRDYVDARDVADAVAALTRREGGPCVVNVGSGTGHRVLDVREVVERVTGATLTVHHVEPRPTDVTAVVLDVARLGGLVDWRPRPLVDGVRDAWRALAPHDSLVGAPR